MMIQKISNYVTTTAVGYSSLPTKESEIIAQKRIKTVTDILN